MIKGQGRLAPGKIKGTDTSLHGRAAVKRRLTNVWDRRTGDATLAGGVGQPLQAGWAIEGEAVPTARPQARHVGNSLISWATISEYKILLCQVGSEPRGGTDLKTVFEVNA